MTKYPAIKRLKTISQLSVSYRLTIGLIFLGALSLLMIIIALSTGPVGIPLSHTISSFIEWTGFGSNNASETEKAVIQNIRLPRIILAFVIGAGLGCSGAVMQGIFRNPMADPGIIGISAGGALGAVIAISTGLTLFSTFFLPSSAFSGSIIAMILVFVIGSTGSGRFSTSVLLLAGVAISAFFSAITAAVILLTANLVAQREMLFWLAGGFDSTRWEDVNIAIPLIITGLLVTLLYSRDLNLLLIGEDEAKSLGLRVTRIRTLLLIISSLITGTAVAFSGTIAFVGLIVPHTLRLIFGADHRVILPVSTMGGGLFLLFADTIARLIIEPAEIRVGIITAFFGAPFFLFLLIRHKSHASIF